MAIAKLSLVNIVGETTKLDEVLHHCMGRGDFHPEKTMDQATDPGISDMNDENPYAELLGRLSDLGVRAGFAPQNEPKMAIGAARGESSAQELERFETFCTQFGEKLDSLREERNYLRGEIEQGENALNQLSHLYEMDVDFDSLFSCRYLKLRIGRLPVDSKEKLGYYNDKMFVFVQLGAEKEYCWGIYFTPQAFAPEIDDLFASLYFERIRIPNFVHGTPETAFAQIKEELARDRTRLNEVQKELSAILTQHKPLYMDVFRRLRFLSDSFDLRRYVTLLRRSFVQVFYLTGFVPADHAESFAEEISVLEGVTVEVLPSDSDLRIKEPTKLKNGWFAKPFEMFVEMYGLPSYNDVDPTGFVAFTYCLLFGIMFGDLGQGLTLVVLGGLLWRFKRMNLGRIMNRIGMFSCAFGLLFGSVFGYEDLLTPLYVNVLGLPGKPIHVMDPGSTNVILLSATGLGVVLICFSICLDIYISLRKKDFERALYSANGAAGLIFYGALILAAVMMFTGGPNLFTPAFILPFMVLPLGIILLKEPLGKLTHGVPFAEAKPEEPGAFFIENSFELFDVLLGFFSNTMSFLRVGGFVLSHAGMMAVVFTLSEMVGNAASLPVIIIGNLFVMCIEGLIVGIQVLRLEFYEMFSRYFDGDGKPFTAIGVDIADN